LASLVDRIRRNEPDAMEEMYQMFSTGIRFLLYRQLGPQDLDDKIHDVFVIITEAICSGELREPERLMGYVHTVVRRQVASHIDRAVHMRRNRVDVGGRDLPEHGFERNAVPLD
jgi:DNA-directed RNA polymerase specialized sigma24 family protein